MMSERVAASSACVHATSPPSSYTLLRGWSVVSTTAAASARSAREAPDIRPSPDALKTLKTLKSLEGDGLVERHVQSTLPPNVDYRLTPAGERVADAVKELILSLYGVMPDVMKVRARSADGKTVLGKILTGTSNEK